ncbi:peptidylprolyl isomerase [Flavobacterium pedocola]
MKKLVSVFILLAAFSFTSCEKEHDKRPDGIYADIETVKGNILVSLEFQKTPVTVANFISLAEGKNPFVNPKYKGKHFYDGLIFHRVINHFMVQGGDPEGTGNGNPGYKFKDEFNPTLKHDSEGVLSMANAGPNTNGSQFFITHNATPHLDGMHTVFGKVVEGMDVVNTIESNDEIISVTIIRKGKDANKFDAPKVFKDYYDKEAVELKKMADQYAEIQTVKTAEFESYRKKAIKTESGLKFAYIKKSGNAKPNPGTEVMFSYAGYFTNGLLFDTNYAEVAKAYGKYDINRDRQGGYAPFPFTYGNKQGLIPGFIEGMEKMAIGDKVMLFIPSYLAYGERGAQGAIPPNTDLIFEMELSPAK